MHDIQALHAEQQTQTIIKEDKQVTPFSNSATRVVYLQPIDSNLLQQHQNEHIPLLNLAGLPTLDL